MERYRLSNNLVEMASKMHIYNINTAYHSLDNHYNAITLINYYRKIMKNKVQSVDMWI